MNVVIDADGLLYRSGFAAETRRYVVQGNEFESAAKARDFMREFEIEGDPEILVDAEPVSHVLHTLRLQIDKIRSSVAAEYGDCKQCLIVLSGPKNYRYEIATIRPYKGNRDQAHKPVHMQAMKDYLRSQHGAIFSDGVEADDVIAQIGTSNRGRVVMASMDKDLVQVPGLHYDFLHDMHFEIDPDTGLCNLYGQILTGDSTDNITGCYRMGEKGANDLITGIREQTPCGGLLLEQRLYFGTLNCYEQSIEKFAERCPYHGMAAEEALEETAHLVYLRRFKDDQWKPPQLQL